jgi:hypothetical protein
VAWAFKAQAPAGDGGGLQLAHRPDLALGRLAAQLGRREAVEQLVIGRMHGDQLALQVGRQLGDLQAVAGQQAGDVVAIGLALGGQGQVEERVRPAGRHLHADIAEVGDPRGHGLQLVERRLAADELGQEDGRPLERLHRPSPSSATQPASARLAATARSTKAMPRTPSAMSGTSPPPVADDGVGEVAIDVGEGLDEAFGMARRHPRHRLSARAQIARPGVQHLAGSVQPVQGQFGGALVRPGQAALLAIDADFQAVAGARRDLRGDQHAARAALEPQQHVAVVVQARPGTTVATSAHRRSTRTPATNSAMLKA